MQFFKENNGNLSMMRLMALIAMLASIALAFFGKDAVIVGLFLTAATVPKVIQKNMEQ